MADWIEDAEVKLDQSNTIAVANRHLKNRNLNIGLLHNDSLLERSTLGREPAKNGHSEKKFYGRKFLLRNSK